MSVDGREPLMPADHDYPAQYLVGGIRRTQWGRIYRRSLIFLIFLATSWVPLGFLIWLLFE